MNGGKAQTWPAHLLTLWDLLTLATHSRVAVGTKKIAFLGDSLWWIAQGETPIGLESGRVSQYQA